MHFGSINYSNLAALTWSSRLWADVWTLSSKIWSLRPHVETFSAACGHVLEASWTETCDWSHQTVTYTSDVLHISRNKTSIIQQIFSDGSNIIVYLVWNRHNLNFELWFSCLIRSEALLCKHRKDSSSIGQSEPSESNTAPGGYKQQHSWTLLVEILSAYLQREWEGEIWSTQKSSVEAF